MANNDHFTMDHGQKSKKIDPGFVPTETGRRLETRAAD